MIKKLFYVFLILFLCVCLSFGLVACRNNNISSDQDVCIGDNNSNESKNSSNDAWGQFGAAALGGICSIFGGIAGALLTVFVTSQCDKKKIKYAHLYRYYKVLNNYKLEIESHKKEDFNLGKFQSIITRFTNELNEDPSLFYYILKKYYKSESENFENKLANYCIKYEHENKTNNDLYDILLIAFNEQIKKIQKELN